MNDTQRAKKKFRSSKRWKEWRHLIHVKYKGKDPITDKKLLKGSECHHLLLDENRYGELDENNYIPLNKNTHKFIHWAYGYYKDDEGFLERLKFWLDKMKKINKN